MKEDEFSCPIGGKTGKKKDDLFLSANFQDAIFSCEETKCYRILNSNGDTKSVTGLDDFDLSDIFKGSVVYNDALWIVYNDPDELTSHFLGADEIKDGPTYPEGRVGACNVQINETHALVTGGNPNGTSTMFINFETQEWTLGPEMNHFRADHQCAKLIIDGQIVALGMLNETFLVTFKHFVLFLKSMKAKIHLVL